MFGWHFQYQQMAPPSTSSPLGKFQYWKHMPDGSKTNMRIGFFYFIHLDIKLIITSSLNMYFFIGQSLIVRRCAPVCVYAWVYACSCGCGLGAFGSIFQYRIVQVWTKPLNHRNLRFSRKKYMTDHLRFTIKMINPANDECLKFIFHIYHLHIQHFRHRNE